MRERVGSKIEWGTDSKIDNNVDLEVVKNYELKLYGPKVGTVELLDPRTQTKITADVCVEESRDYQGCKEFKIIVNNFIEGFIVLREDELGKGYYKTEESSRKHDKYDSEEFYGNNYSEKKPEKIFIENMASGSVSNSIYGDDHRPSMFKNVGQRLHELAVEYSLKKGYAGRVQLQVHGNSLGFHEQFGFLGEDVYNPDGSLHHHGQQLHENIAVNRFDASKDYPNHKTYKTKKDYIKLYGEKKDYVIDKETKLYMYLPPEIIEKEKRRSEERPVFIYNTVTIEALVKKHQHLSNAGYLLDRIKLYLKDHPGDLYNTLTLYEKLAIEYSDAGEKLSAKKHVDTMLEILMQKGEDDNSLPPDLNLVAKTYKYLGLIEESQRVWNKAGDLEAKQGYHELAKKYYSLAGNEEKLRGEYRDPSIRDW